jgi:hypothetical protein
VSILVTRIIPELPENIYPHHLPECSPATSAQPETVMAALRTTDV